MSAALNPRWLAPLLALLTLGAAAQAPVPPTVPAPPSLDNPLNRNPARRASAPSDAVAPLPTDGRDSTTRPTEPAASGFDPVRDAPATLPEAPAPTMGSPKPAL